MKWPLRRKRAPPPRSPNEIAADNLKRSLVWFDPGLVTREMDPPVVSFQTYDASSEEGSLLSDRSVWSATESSSSTSSESSVSSDTMHTTTPRSPLAWQLDRLEASFGPRTRLWLKLASACPPAVHRRLWQHEAEFRRLQRKQVLEEYVYGPGGTRTEWCTPSLACSAFRLEATTTGRTVFCLLCHCVFHVGWYECVTGLMAALVPANHCFTDAINAMVLLGGVLLLRLAGDLYWWAADADFFVAKFRMHHWRRNRIGKILRFVRNRPALRATTFLFGYYLVYFSVNHFHGRVVGLLGNISVGSHDLLKDLPSRNHDLSDYFVDLVGEDQTLIDRGDAAACRGVFLDLQQEAKELRALDEAYTNRVLSQGSYETYWAQQVTGTLEREVEGLIDPWTDWCTYLGLTFLAGVLMCRYGFPLFENY